MSSFQLKVSWLTLVITLSFNMLCLNMLFQVPQKHHLAKKRSNSNTTIDIPNSATIHINSQWSKVYDSGLRIQDAVSYVPQLDYALHSQSICNYSLATDI